MIDSDVQRSSASLVWASLAILFFICAVLFVIQIFNLSRARAVDSERQAQIVGIVTSPDARVVLKNDSQTDATPRPVVVSSHSRGFVLFASGLPRLPDGKTFELWLAPQTSKGIVFGSTPSHSAEVVAAAPTGPATLIVTIEDESGADAPTTPPLFTVPLH